MHFAIFTFRLMAAIILATPALAQDSDAPLIIREIPVMPSNSLTYTFGFGGGFGTYTSKTGLARDYGGVAADIRMLDENLTKFGTIGIGGSILVDTVSRQAIRKRFEAILMVPLIGGKQRSIKRLPIADIATGNRHALNLVAKVQQDYFSVTPAKVGLDDLKGSVLSLATGLSLLWGYQLGRGLGVEATTTVFSAASSVENASAISTDILLFAQIAF